MIAIRPYRAEDRAECAALFYRAVHEGAAGAYDAVQRADWAPSPLPDLSKPDRKLDQFAWVSEADGRITGFMTLTREGHLDMAFVLPEVMGKGHAAALYDVLLDRARAEGMNRLTVHATPYSKSFLMKRGWVLDKVEPFVSDGGVAYMRNYLSLALDQGAR
ncbi:GNAT family N-acetyltransferase [Aliigemmobacter aestuarii]|uniref:GNAT family N-acetyltransferase n=1 Tax=Aliigemmobacter aestuarii TaxID=1445661 RepID=A0A4S3MLW3_9RHOB|nr:GNAT family N-acetyltransferase [Gemmobacter aestuarii]THD82792.1 GNAT family N-acetyltransferase [Gemmobacter aestuarii]